MTTESRKWREGLAERLRALVGRNEADFARQIAVQPATFNTYTTGRTVPPLDVIWRAVGYAGGGTGARTPDLLHAISTGAVRKWLRFRGLWRRALRGGGLR